MQEFTDLQIFITDVIRTMSLAVMLAGIIVFFHGARRVKLPPKFGPKVRNWAVATTVSALLLRSFVLTYQHLDIPALVRLNLTPLWFLLYGASFIHIGLLFIRQSQKEAATHLIAKEVRKQLDEDHGN